MLVFLLCFPNGFKLQILEFRILEIGAMYVLLFRHFFLSLLALLSLDCVKKKPTCHSKSRKVEKKRHTFYSRAFDWKLKIAVISHTMSEWYHMSFLMGSKQSTTTTTVAAAAAHQQKLIWICMEWGTKQWKDSCIYKTHVLKWLYTHIITVVLLLVLLLLFYSRHLT